MSLLPTETVDIRERQYISQYAPDVLGLRIYKAGVLSAVDGPMTVTLVREADAVQALSRPALTLVVGEYEIILASSESATPGLYTVIWTYALGGVAQEYRTYVEIGQADFAYDQLAPAMKDLVDTTWLRFADLFDSPAGGPNLMTYFQTHYTRGRVAALLRIAVGTLNTIAQPFQTFTIDGDGGASFPTARWGPLAERSLYIECLKHLRRSYVEQPMFVGGSITRLDRRDYLDRWGMILTDEVSYFQRELDVFKIASMGLGRPAVLVSGGVFGRFGPTRVAGQIAARPRLWSRFYAILLISGSASGLGSVAWHQNQDQPGTSVASTRIVQQSTSGNGWIVAEALRPVGPGSYPSSLPPGTDRSTSLP